MQLATGGEGETAPSASPNITTLPCELGILPISGSNSCHIGRKGAGKGNTSGDFGLGKMASTAHSEHFVVPFQGAMIPPVPTWAQHINVVLMALFPPAHFVTLFAVI